MIAIPNFVLPHSCTLKLATNSSRAIRDEATTTTGYCYAWAAAVASGVDTTTLADGAALADYVGRVPPGEPIAIESVVEGGPPAPTISVVGLYHPAAGRDVRLRGSRRLGIGGGVRARARGRARPAAP